MIRAALLRPASASSSSSAAAIGSRAPKSNTSVGAAAARYLSAGGPSPSPSPSPLSSSRCPSMVTGVSLCRIHARSSLLARRNDIRPPRRPAARTMASGASGQKESANDKSTSEGGAEGSQGGATEEPTSQEMVLTPGEKVVAGTRLFFWAGAFAFASVCAYYIGKELIPTKMSPNTVFDKATAEIRDNAEVKRRFGDSFKTYGRDHGGHREGRRNFVEHTEYTDPEDGSKRTRVRFNLEGPYGTAFVFAEVSKDMPSGEFVYILVQDKRNGTVITVQDNRSALLAKRLAGGSREGQDVFSNLLGGGGSKK